MQPPVPITRSKLHRPRLATNLVQRNRLLAWFEQHLTTPVVHVAAPIGFGKTSLVGAWSKKAPFSCAWLALDADDNDLRRFSSYFVAAIRTLFPNSLQATAELVDSSILPTPAQLASTLINELDELPTDFYLILDNYHTIREKSVSELTSQLVRHLPAQVHLILVTRTDSPLPLARLRAEGRLGELRSGDLRFTAHETREFFERNVAMTLAPETIQLLHERTEGWPVALRFASQLIRRGSAPQQVVDQLTSARRYRLMDYMLKEIIDEHRAPIRELMLRTSLLERFTPEMCQAVLPENESQGFRAMLDELAFDETLVQTHEGKFTWYSYHGLFGEFLRNRAASYFDAATISGVYQNASAWLASQGLVIPAIVFALKTGDPTAAARLVREHLHANLNNESARPNIEKWLALFPDQMLQEQLDLMPAQLWLAILQGKTTVLPGLIEKTQRLLDQTNPDDSRRLAIRADLAYAQAGHAQWSNDGATAVEIASKYYHAIPEEHALARGNMLTELALAQQMVGNTDRALSVLTDALRQDQSPASEFTLRALFGFAGVYLNNADFESLARISERLLALAQDHSHISLVSAHYFLGLVHYEWNNPDEAAHHFGAATALRHRGHAKPGYESLAWLALVQQARGFHDAADQARRELANYARSTNSRPLLQLDAAYGARLALAQGDLDAALAWATTAEISRRPHMIFEVETNLTRLAILLAVRRPPLLRSMLQETGALLELARSLHNKRRVIQLLALTAVAEHALGKRQAAQAALQEALTLAEPGNLIRTFLDTGPDMIGLIKRHMTRSKASPYIKRILSANAGARVSDHPELAAAKPGATQPVEPLTVRESQVLEHLAMRLTDKEIARALVISPLTVKAHTDNIYQKLGVNSRQAAVRVGVQVGILSEKVL